MPHMPPIRPNAAGLLRSGTTLVSALWFIEVPFAFGIGMGSDVVRYKDMWQNNSEKLGLTAICHDDNCTRKYATSSQPSYSSSNNQSIATWCGGADQRAILNSQQCTEREVESRLTQAQKLQWQ